MPIPAIAFDVTPLQNAHRFRGIGTYVRGLARRLAAQDQVPIEFWGWAGDEPFVPPAPHHALWLPRTPMPVYRGAWLFARFAMRRRSRRSDVRAVHVTDPDALTALGGRTLLTTVYDLIPLRQGQSRRRLVARAGYGSYLHTLRRADQVFAISGQTSADLVELLQVPPGRILVARPGIDLPQSTVTPAPAGRPYFLYLGGPNPNKNLAVLLDAMVAIGELPEELRIAGHWLPKQVAALDADLQARRLQQRVRHVGFVPGDELVGLMRGATAMVVPSLLEGFGLPVGEGLAAGAVVIHSRIPVLEETSGGAALTFDPRSPQELSACMRQAAGDAKLRDDLRRRGVERARELTWDAAVKTTLEAYHAVTGR